MTMTRTEMFDMIADYEAIFEADLETGCFTWTSKPMGTMFGYYQSGELEGEPIEMLLPQEKRVAHKGHRAAYLASPEARLMGNRTMTLEGVRKDGTRLPIEISLIPRKIGKRWIVLGKVLSMESRR